MKPTIFFGVFSAVLGLMSASAEVDCLKLSLVVKGAVAAEQSKVLEIVSKEVAVSPDCACEVVKAAIEGSSAKPETVAAIVEAAANAAPEHIRIIAQCAVAVAPDSLAAVQKVLAKYDVNAGEPVSSSKSAKGGAGEVASAANPLDFPGQDPLAHSGGDFGGDLHHGGEFLGDGGAGGGPPGLGGGGGFGPPIIINPPNVTDVNPAAP